MNNTFFDFRKTRADVYFEKVFVKIQRIGCYSNLTLFFEMREYFFEKIGEYTIFNCLKKLDSCRYPEKEVIDFFIESIKDNPEILDEKNFAKEIEEFSKESDCGEDFIEAVRSEIWKFKKDRKKIKFFVSNLKITCSVTDANDATKYIFTFYTDKYIEHIVSYNVFDWTTKNHIIESFLFGLRYSKSDYAIDYLKQVVCTRNEKWVKEHGM